MGKPVLSALFAMLMLTACQATHEKALDSAAADKAIDAVTDPTLTAAVTGADAEPSPEKDESVAAIKPASKVVPGETYVPPAPGTVFTWRNNWSSLPPVISYKVAGLVKAGDVEYLQMTSVGGIKETVHAYYDTRNFALKGYRDTKDHAILTYKPVEERYRFPLKAGERWVTAWKSFDHRTKKEISGGGVVEVIGLETIDLPAGSFQAFKVRMPTAPDMPKGMNHFVWFAPKLGVTVKEQIGNGTMNWTQILEKVELPSS